MKAFRGTLFALVALLLVTGLWYAGQPEPAAVKPVTAKNQKKETGLPLFVFEKADMVKVEVKRTEGTIVLAERADGWWLEGENLRASKSMVNRVKHQLHDLVARATVIENPGEDALYGFGADAIHVTLHFRDGSSREFDAGDPNPSGVSFYIRPNPGDAVYTVKKSAVDYYALSLAEFRERRFATFDSKDVDQLEATLANGHHLKLQRSGDHEWELLAPRTFPANDSEVRSLLGRVSAAKAIQFIADDVKDLSAYGLDTPEARIAVRFSSRDPLTLLVGRPTGEIDGSYPTSYAMLEGEGSVYAIRNGLLEDYAAPVESLRLTRFARMEINDLTEVVATLDDHGKDKDLSHTVVIRQEANRWLWDDGVPVPGSTPSRVGIRASSIESEEFVAEEADDARYGFDRPLITVELKESTGRVRTLLVGKAAAPGKRPEGEPYDRYYARVRESPEVYIVDSGVLEVVKDLMREHNRKATADDEKAVRRERIEQNTGAAPAAGAPTNPEKAP